MNIEKATVNILLELDGKVYMVAFHKDNYKAVTTLVKMATENLVETGRTQGDLLDFLGYKKARANNV